MMRADEADMHQSSFSGRVVVEEDSGDVLSAVRRDFEVCLHGHLA